MARKYEDISGQKHGKLKVLHQINNKIGTHYLCECECGAKTTATVSQLLFNKKISCGCSRKQKQRDKNRKNVLIRKLFREKITNARHPSDDFLKNIKLFEYIITSPCFYCGKAPNVIKEDRGKSGNLLSDCTIIHHGIDRIDPRLGYEFKNIVPCCKECNFSKKDLSSIEFIKRSKDICDFLGLSEKFWI